MTHIGHFGNKTTAVLHDYWPGSCFIQFIKFVYYTVEGKRLGRIMVTVVNKMRESEGALSTSFTHGYPKEIFVVSIR